MNISKNIRQVDVPEGYLLSYIDMKIAFKFKGRALLLHWKMDRWLFVFVYEEIKIAAIFYFTR